MKPLNFYPFFSTVRKIWIITFICLITMASCKNDKKKVIEFNDKIITEQEALINAEAKLINSLNDRKFDMIKKDYQQLLSQIITSENNVSNLTDPDPNIGFKQAALNMFAVYKNQTQNGYKTLVELTYIPDSLYTPNQAKKFEEISSTVFVTLNAEVTSFISVQNKLAEKYQFSFKK